MNTEQYFWYILQSGKIGKGSGHRIATHTIVRSQSGTNTNDIKSAVKTGMSLTDTHHTMTEKHSPIVATYNVPVLSSQQPAPVRHSNVHCMYCDRYCQNVHNVNSHEQSCKRNPLSSKYVSDIIDVCTSKPYFAFI